MYEQMFNLTSRPFLATAFVPHYFAAETIAQTLSQAKMCIDRASGPVIVTGASGTGKSLLLALLAEQYKSGYRVVILACARLSQRTDLLQNILFELKLPYRQMSEGELRLSLIDYLKSEDCGGKGLLLLVDEAHSLSPELLDELRLITNFIRNGKPHVALVMAGSPSLDDHLIETKSESFNQRIAARCHLANMTQVESIEYVLTHVERVGGNAEEMYTGEALKIIHQASDGCPRVINQICDCAMVLAAGMNTPRITADIARQAWNNVQSIPGSRPVAESANSSASATTKIVAPEEQDSLVIEFGELDDDGDQFASDDEESSGDSRCYEFTSDEMPAKCQTQEVDDQDHEYDNPFEESFDHEDTIHTQFFPLVSEQNLTSLMLTSDQLSILDRLEPQFAAQPAMRVAGDLAVVGDFQTIPAEMELRDDDESADLTLSPEELADLVRIEEDVRRLQRQYSFSQRDGDAQSVYQAKQDHQPWEELMQHHPPMQTGSASAPRQRLDTPSTTNTCSPDDRKATADDRDIMIINDSSEIRRPKTRSGKTTVSPDDVLSVGNATRMDYQDLFRQLRQPQ